MSASSIFVRRRNRVRYGIKKNNKEGRVRLVVCRTNQHIYAQLICDTEGKTLAQASTVDKDIAVKLKSKSNIEAAEAVGKTIAERAKSAKVSDVVFDRGGYLFHGRVKALAEAARAGGLNF
ncbi:MAG: rplR [Rickettsiaceae bacterium]|jgi:large subunit ribosomal protein L18|nr:rplR [Rickettsiaceae bacterium]